MANKKYRITKARVVITNSVQYTRYTFPWTRPLGYTDDIEATRKKFKHEIKNSDIYSEGYDVSIYFTYTEEPA